MSNTLTVGKKAGAERSSADMEKAVEVFNKCKWAAYRLGFYTYAGFSAITGVGGFLAPWLASYYFFGTLKFWKVWSPGWKLNIQVYRILYMTLKGEFHAYVPLTSPPSSAPDRSLVQISQNWEHGESCGVCGVCCARLKCPLFEEDTRMCLGYNSFFWRYLNCGRFPSNQSEIDSYKCRKWEMKPR